MCHSSLKGFDEMIHLTFHQNKVFNELFKFFSTFQVNSGFNELFIF